MQRAGIIAPAEQAAQELIPAQYGECGKTSSRDEQHVYSLNACSEYCGDPVYIDCNTGQTIVEDKRNERVHHQNVNSCFLCMAYYKSIAWGEIKETVSRFIAPIGSD